MIIELTIFISLVVLGFVFGRINEAAHFSNIAKREAATAHMILSDRKTIPQGTKHGQFVSGSVVISIDYYKRIAAGIQMFFGGEIGSYQTLLTRARKEAMLRMVEQAQAAGFEYIANIRLETSSVFQNPQGIGSLEVHAYGTALR